MDNPEWLRSIAFSFALASCKGPLEGGIASFSFFVEGRPDLVQSLEVMLV